MERHGLYQVVGKREYRGHKPGEAFFARLDVNAALRAIQRGDIRLVERFDPSIDPAKLTLPQGWPGT